MGETSPNTALLCLLLLSLLLEAAESVSSGFQERPSRLQSSLIPLQHYRCLQLLPLYSMVNTCNGCVSSLLYARTRFGCPRYFISTTQAHMQVSCRALSFLNDYTLPTVFPALLVSRTPHLLSNLSVNN